MHYEIITLRKATDTGTLPDHFIFNDAQDKPRTATILAVTIDDAAHHIHLLVESDVPKHDESLVSFIAEVLYTKVTGRQYCAKKCNTFPKALRSNMRDTPYTPIFDDNNICLGFKKCQPFVAPYYDITIIVPEAALDKTTKYAHSGMSLHY